MTVSKAYDGGILADLGRDFYKNFAGKYYQGLPVNYILQRGNVGYGIRISEVLTLAIGNGAIWCSGHLEAFNQYGSPESATRHWVEVNDTKHSGYVIEPDWGMAIDKELYYRVFGATVTEKQDYATFIKARQKDPAAVNLYSREDYEEHGAPLNPQLVKFAQDDADLVLRNSRDKKQLAGAVRLVAALPDLTKCKNLVVPTRPKRLTTLQRFGRMPRQTYGDMITEIDPGNYLVDADYTDRAKAKYNDLIVKGY